MSTYLQLCQRLHGILRIGSETPGTQPLSVAGQVDQLYEITRWIRDSHEDICLMRTQWAFMRGSASFTLAPAARTITHAAMLASVPTFSKVVPFVTNNGAYIGISPTSSGAAEDVVEFVPYQHWQGAYDAPPIPVSQPRYFTITPERGLEFDATADREYAVRCNFRKQVVPLQANDDEPMFDADYHGAIVWYAVVNYYCLTRDDTAELQKKAGAKLAVEMNKLFNEQLPDFTIA